MKRNNKAKDQQLKIKITKGVLTISVGINTLAHAFEASDYAQGQLRLKSRAGFAEDVLEALLDEEEDGDTPVYRMLDAAAVAAAEAGSEHVLEVEESDSE